MIPTINQLFTEKEEHEELLKPLYNLNRWPLVQDGASWKKLSQLTLTKPNIIL